VLACTAPADHVELDGDCDDDEAAVLPGGVEVCDGLDNDCNGLLDDDASGSLTWYADSDGDGFGDLATTLLACTQPVGWVADATDCDDTLATVNPSRPEVCNALDDDCDGGIDLGALDASTWFADADIDGFGDAAVSQQACDAPAGFVSSDTDCDDTSASVRPGAAELCNGIDDDCDGATDDGATDAATWYEDTDDDGWGVLGNTLVTCTPPAGWADRPGDCDDALDAVNPEAQESCNALDDDCDGFVDEDGALGGSLWYRDLDGDAFGDADQVVDACSQPLDYVADATDCDDIVPTTFPGAVEVCDGLDNDCDNVIDENAVGLATWYADVDGDGFGNVAGTQQSCAAPAGFVAGPGDCDDDNAAAFPGADEFCDGYDNNCNGLSDEDNAVDAATWYLDFDGDAFGNAGFTTVACVAPNGYVDNASDCDDGRPSIFPGADELCDSLDNDCDSDVDEGAIDPATWYADVDGDTFGDLLTPLEACAAPAGYVADATDCDDSRATVRPGGIEVCNSRDDDCNGTVDDDAINPSLWYADGDGDGAGDALVTEEACAAPAGFVGSGLDCDDADAGVFPGADEVCDGVDQDCDNQVDEQAVDAGTFYGDADGDTFGNPLAVTVACNAPIGAVSRAGDCNDGNAAVNPAAVETCDGVDEDCDGDVDNGAISSTTWYADSDADGFGNPTVSSTTCTPPAGYVTDATDCDDSMADVNPDADEICNTLDDDCDGDVDVDAIDAPSWYMDGDGDTWGLAGTEVLACVAPAGTVDRAGDCDDAADGVNPGATEVCNSVDDDCSGDVDDGAVDASLWRQDGDGDGFGNAFIGVTACAAPQGFVADGTDCADNDPNTFPGATELCDGVDNNCNGTTDEGAIGVLSWYADSDGDGFGDPDLETLSCTAVAGAVLDDRDCDDTDAAINPLADEICNGADDDCDGTDDNDAIDADSFYVDGDGDGFGDLAQRVLACAAPTGTVGTPGDCDDGDAAVNPAAAEVCDGVDNDCNGSDDDNATDASTWFRDGDGDDFGNPATATLACTQPAGFVADDTDCDDGLSTVYPNAPELCDGFDNDCDAAVDEGQVGNATWYADSDGDGFGDPDVSQAACARPAGFVLDDRDCDDTTADVSPAAPERCNNRDDDCNGTPDDGAVDALPFYVDGDGDSFGAGSPVLACAAPTGTVAQAGDCDDGDGGIFPGAVEVCDGADQDCNGLTDDNASDAATFYRDADGDTFGNAAFTREACTRPAGFVSDATDCFDNDATSFPGADETCDGRDNDCDGSVDDGATDARTWYADSDGDSFGDAAVSQLSCNQPASFVTDARDCDDGDPTVNPSAVETCDGVDEDCNGSTDDNAVDRVLWYLDADGDEVGGAVGGQACVLPPQGVLTGGDCDDTDPDDYPGAPEECDGEDDDCDGVVDGPNPVDGTTFYLDVDGDGFAGAQVSTLSCEAPTEDWLTTAEDCNDGLATAFPGADELCDGQDNDCDNAVDEDVTDATAFFSDGDGDGYGDPGTRLEACLNPGGLITQGGDCDDGNVDVNPGVTETCNGVDDNCDTNVDEPTAADARTWFRDADADSYGNVDFTVEACTQPGGYVDNDFDCNDLSDQAFPGNTEVCDTLDNDCNGSTDEPSAVDAGIWLRDDDGDGFGLNGATQRACTTPAGFAATGGDCDDGEATVNPAATEFCNSVDDNCDGVTDEDSAADADLWYADFDADGYGDPNAPRFACQVPADHVDDDTDCNDSDVLVNPLGTEVCNARDDDCSGRADDNNANCPHPLHYFDGSVYMFSLDALPWQDARAFCFSYGYQMLAIDDQAENFWSDGISDSYSQEKWWTGGNDIASEGVWVWDDGDELFYDHNTRTEYGYNNWHPGEPNNVGSAPGGEDCLQYNRWGDGTWNDEPCGSAFRFICEAVERP
jgi:hypothetical protein